MLNNNTIRVACVLEYTCSFWIGNVEGRKRFKGESGNENFRGVGGHT